MKPITISLVLLAALASCAEVEEQAPRSKDGEIHVTAGMDYTKTRATADASTGLSGATFVIKEGTAVPSNNFSGGTTYTGNVAAGTGKVTFSGGTPHYNVNNNNAYMVAYFPGGALTNNAVEWTIDGKTDIMLTNNIWDAGKYSAPQTTGLNFNHRLARIEVALIAQGAGGEANVPYEVVQAAWGKVAKVELLNAPTKMKYSLTGTPTVSTSTPDALPLLKDYSGAAFTAIDIHKDVTDLNLVVDAVAMVAPVAPTSSESFKLRVTTTGASTTPTTPIVVEVPVSLNSNKEPMKAGYTHKVVLTFKPYDKKIEVTSSTIEAWEPGYAGGMDMNTPTVVEYGVSPYQIISGMSNGTSPKPYTVKAGEWKSYNSYTNSATEGAGNGVTGSNVFNIFEQEAPYRKFEIAKTDESAGAMSWGQAWTACKAKYPAGEWRLPRLSEFVLIQLNWNAIKNINGFVDFKDDFYWSGTDTGSKLGWIVNPLHLSTWNWDSSSKSVSVRCIREIPTAPVILDFKSSTTTGMAGINPASVTLTATTSSYNNHTYNATDASNNGGYYNSADDSSDPKSEKVYAKLEIAKESEYGDATQRSWQAAWDACKARAPKGEWRLPRVSEFILFYLNRDKIKQSEGFTDFTDAHYWAGTERNSTQSWLFKAGGWYFDYKVSTNYEQPRRVRCVREIPLAPTILERGKSPNSTVSGTFEKGTPPASVTLTVGSATSKSYNYYANTAADAALNGGYKPYDVAIAEAPYQRLEIAKEDETVGTTGTVAQLTWADAWTACKKKLPAGTWRLPRISELMLIFLNKTTLTANSEYYTPLTPNGYYRSGTEYSIEGNWDLYIDNHEVVNIPAPYKSYTHRVRCVRER